METTITYITEYDTKVSIDVVYDEKGVIQDYNPRSHKDYDFDLDYIRELLKAQNDSDIGYQ